MATTHLGCDVGHDSYINGIGSHKISDADPYPSFTDRVEEAGARFLSILIVTIVAIYIYIYCCVSMISRFSQY